MKKIFVLDTSVLVHNPNSLLSFGNNVIIIPIGVLEELDGLKKANGEKGFNAREALRILDAVIDEHSDISSGVKIGQSEMFFDINSNGIDILPREFHQSTDNNIIASALRAKRRNSTTRVILISKDTNLRVKARALGIEAEDYKSDKIKHLPDQKKSIEVVLTDAGVLQELCQKEEIEKRKVTEKNFKPNQCLILRSGTKFILAVYKRQKNILVLVRKPEDFSGAEIYPRNTEQAFAYHLALDPEIGILSLTGRAGTGKTLLALAAGYSMLKERYSKIVIFRPTVEVEGSLGYLPGDVQEKIMPRVQPITNNLRLIIERSTKRKTQTQAEARVNDMIKSGIVEIIPVNFIRGATLHNAFIIVDEAQNFTPHGIKTIITRVGEGSKIVFTGDLSQIDHQYLDPLSSGLTKLISVFQGKDFFASLSLQKGERSKLAEEAAKLM